MDQRTRSEHPLTSEESTVRRRVLVIDDHPTNRLVMQTILGELGCEVGLACDGIEGVAAAALAPFDIVVMDRNMPRRDGDEATRLIRALPSASSDAFIVLWTTDPSDLPIAGRYDDTLAKPVSFPAVVAMLLRAAAHGLSHPSVGALTAKIA